MAILYYQQPNKPYLPKKKVWRASSKWKLLSLGSIIMNLGLMALIIWKGILGHG